MRAGRLLSVLLLLQARGRMTAQQLADELEVSVRTVYRDVEALASAGVPLYGDPGRDGGYRLLDGWRTRLTGLTVDEAGSLFLAGMPGPAADLGLGAVLAAAQIKLAAALPAELRDRAGRIRERFHLDAPGWYREADDVPYLAAVASAVWDQRAIRVRYRRWAAPQEVTRVLDPYGLVLKGGRWYLVAGAGAGAAGPVRTYRVSQILRIEAGEERSFDRPAGFDLAAYWASYLEGFDTRRHRLTATVRISPRGLRRLPDVLEQAAVRAVERGAGPPDAEGWTRADIPIESVEHAEAELLRLGTDVEVLAPHELRTAMARTAEAIARRHRR